MPPSARKYSHAPTFPGGFGTRFMDYDNDGCGVTLDGNGHVLDIERYHADTQMPNPS